MIKQMLKSATLFSQRTLEALHQIGINYLQGKTEMKLDRGG